MCGICGQVHAYGITDAQLQPMTETLHHRGPDDQGFYIGDGVGLGHCRLSIIDLGGGQQPMTNEDESLWIVFNGEIYNYQELRADLAARHHFVTNSDTEIILHLYEEWGERCVEQLRGMFAFAIWDTKTHTLFLARDHLGQKPLFYAWQGERFLFASEIKAILGADPTLKQVDGKALHQYFTLRIIAPPHTMFAGVRKLQPGHTLTYRAGQVQLRRYWSLRYEPKHQMSEADLLDELEERMLETVRYHLVSDVPVGAFLSGGIDSSLVVAMMSKLSAQPVKTFAGGIPHAHYSELPYARIVADQYQTEHFEETFAPSLVRILPALVWHLDEPSDHLSAPMYYLAAMARKEVKVVLDGSGGDELFGGYDRYYGNHYVNYYALLPRTLRKHLLTRLLRVLPDGTWYKSFSHKLKWMNHLSFSEGGRRYAQSLSYFYFTEEFRNQLYGVRLQQSLNGFDAEEAIYGYFDSANANELVDKMLFADSMVRLPDHPVMILDRTTMAHGLEARSPFMDHKLTEFVAQIPATLKVRGRTRRYLQLRLAERYLPPTLLRRNKQGFSSGLPYLLADEFRHLFQVFLLDSHLVRDGYLCGEAINKLLQVHLQKKSDQGNRLWLLCNAELWYRMKIEDWPKAKIQDALASAPVTG
jgi:asparagine synthase (glutamine-hydrolysing)